MNPEEVYQSLVPTLNQYIKDLDNYTDDQFNYKPNEKSWSIGQVYEHLFGATRLFFFNIKSCLNQENGSFEGSKNDIGENIYKHNSFPPIKIKKPKEYDGPDPIAKEKEAYKDILNQTILKLEKTLDMVSKDDGSYKVAHPVLGMLTAKEWYQMIDIHFRHHFRQISDINDHLSKM